MSPGRLEEVSLNSWPVLQQILFDGWILRFSRGYTKRANSVNPLFGSSMDVDEKVDVCEKLYAEKGSILSFVLRPSLHRPTSIRFFKAVSTGNRTSHLCYIST